jgi:hypothetical protein
MIATDWHPWKLRQVENLPGMERFLAQKCSYCGRPYRSAPCERSDHYRSDINSAIEKASEPMVSHACEYPRDQQAPISPSYQGRRHPYEGDRPQWSGFCVADQCACDCHRNDTLDELHELE